jgi:hypothetical protein
MHEVPNGSVKMTAIRMGSSFMAYRNIIGIKTGDVKCEYLPIQDEPGGDIDF